MKNISIIGGGIGGMMSALLLSVKGFNVTLFEKEAVLGGRLAFHHHGNTKIDKGPTIVLLPDMLKGILKEAGVHENDYELIECDPLYDIHFADGTTYTKYRDKDKQMAEISRVFPGEEAGFKEFMADMTYRFNEGKPRFLEQSFLTRWQTIQPATLNSLRKLKAFRSVSKQLQAYFTDDRLKTAYALQTLYIGGNPFATPGIYSLVSYSEHEHGIYYVKGGYASLVDVLERAMDKRGVRIVKKAKIEEVVIEGGKASGIKYNGIFEKTDAVVLNGDFPIAEKLVRQQGRQYQPSSGCMLLYAGIKGRYVEKKIHQFYMGENFERNMNQIFKEQRIPEDPSYYVFNPSIIDANLAPEGESVLYVLIPVPSGDTIDWTKEKDRLAKQVLSRMETQGFTDLKERLNWLDIRTPEEAKMEGLYAGGSFGIAPTLFQSGPFRPQFQPYPELKNVFAVGASVHPGGGVPIVMQGAKLLADGIEKMVHGKDEIKHGTDESV
ncbi:NAD(P)/FAD-dependent oxidoreductase [Jeotgalibacillus sp. R-1-5s-1]|uniref:phytoene desaturase family protein n=1 Tax=Jeotgalibacillus sp. R-1-5s-1 TaxID=2555897 RepID=UPI00106DA360|nr:phytoene desaturase family protein [Jeotgalibacillus sp. R-1-5s-1]TFD97626.1 phytoene desaturase [Jeotgalibacillus sp. R-1-5s-1]